jgi:hypothetical protein
MSNVERDGGDAGSGELVAIGGVSQARRAPHFIALRQRPRDRERDLACGPGDQDLLCVEHPFSHSAP